MYKNLKAKNKDKINIIVSLRHSNIYFKTCQNAKGYERLKKINTEYIELNTFDKSTQLICMY